MPKQSLNPFQIVDSDHSADAHLFNQPSQPFETITLKRIKERKLKHRRSFGRGANHPSFFLRQFYKILISLLDGQPSTFNDIYEEWQLLLKKQVDRARDQAKRGKFNLDDLQECFGENGKYEQLQKSYLNSKLFFKAISKFGLELVMKHSKCKDIVNHLISLEKYSSRLANPLLVGRVEFQ